jgi:hypothetical protein
LSVCRGLQFRDLGGIRLFAVKDRGNVGDRSWRSNEGGRQRLGLLFDFLARGLLGGQRDRNIGATVGGIERLHNAVANFRGGKRFACLPIAAPAMHA